ncbi:unnamed protein product [Cyprideis torosa]|uniref:Uncharacterized protein n=1 Tax=Cyprideis torosa TaxID=163714 RepID=A0A7R8WBD1_9CRUS|nr:unnamed protein product [Cyprideis torosa]CAG0889447.1 unnamed protein product [Cyprideis torosa]
MVWEQAKEVLQNTLSESVYALWIEPLECAVLSEDNISLACPDRFFSAYVADNFKKDIEEAIAKTGTEARKVVFTVGLGTAKGVQAMGRPQSRGNQQRLPHIPKGTSVVKALHPRYTFDEFMVGESNILAQSACRSISAADDSVGPCLYINSETGLGKSHLTHAVAHQVLAESPMTRLHYVTAQQFSREMVFNIQANTMGAFKQKYLNHCDMLLVEDVHHLKGKKKTQEELNELLDFLIKSGKRVVMTANRPPRDLDGLDGEFRSRMAAGLVTAIQAPDRATREGILLRKARQHKVDLAEEHIDYLAQHIEGDVRQIESAVVRIAAKSRLNDGKVDLGLIEEVVTAIVGLHRFLSPAMVRDFICKQYNVTCNDLQSRSRKKSLTFPRQVAMYLCRKHTASSLADIGREFRRDHSTVLHSIKVVTSLSNRDISIAQQINLLSKKLKKN